MQEEDDAKGRSVDRVLELIRQLKGEEGDEVQQLEFFFYSRDITYAHMLAGRLRKLEYQVEVLPSAHSHLVFLITGLTPKMDLHQENMVAWADLMERIAEHFQCDFDGWGSLME